MSSKTEPKYGIPYRCPRCPEKHFYGLLRVPNERLRPCPNCGSRLVPASELPPPHHLVDTRVEKQGY